MEMKYIKSAARVLNRDCVNKGGLDISKNVLWVSVGQGAAVYELSKLEVRKNSADQPGAGKAGSNQADQQNFFLTTNSDSS